MVRQERARPQLPQAVAVFRDDGDLLVGLAVDQLGAGLRDEAAEQLQIVRVVRLGHQMALVGLRPLEVVLVAVGADQVKALGRLAQGADEVGGGRAARAGDQNASSRHGS